MKHPRENIEYKLLILQTPLKVANIDCFSDFFRQIGNCKFKLKGKSRK